MTGKELYNLGHSSPAARACIPLNIQHTPPRIVWKNGWAAQFWYYRMDSEDMAVYSPQFFLELELPSGHPVEMKRISSQTVSLGISDDLLTPSFNKYINDYLKQCEKLLILPPDSASIEKLHKHWKSTHPFVLAKWFNNTVHTSKEELPVPPSDPNYLLEKDPVAYWKKEQLKAIREGNDEAAEKARKKMNEAAAERKNRNKEIR